jgi:hypothetical protein
VPVGLGGGVAVTEPARFGDSTASSDPSGAPELAGAAEFAVTLWLAGALEAPGRAGAAGRAGVPASVWELAVTALSFSGAPSADRPGGNAAGRAPAFLAGTPGWPGPRSWRAFLAA